MVTGGFGKLGPVWAAALADAGASVVLVDRPGAEPSPRAEALLGSGRAVATAGDVCDRAALERALEYCETTIGRPSVLVNNAGIDQPPTATESYRLEDIPAGRVEEVLRVNVTGAFVATQVFGGAMATGGGGSVVNIGSLYASVSPDARVYDHIEIDPPFLKPPAYGASKAALVNLTRYFATHWASRGVRVNALSPGGVAGGQDPQFLTKFVSRVPMGRLAEPEDLAGPIVFLASDASSYVTGIDLEVNGGYTAW